MEPLEMTLLYDYYGDLLTERQRSCVDLVTIRIFPLRKLLRSWESAARGCLIISAVRRRCFATWKKRRAASAAPCRQGKQSVKFCPLQTSWRATRIRMFPAWRK